MEEGVIEKVGDRVVIRHLKEIPFLLFLSVGFSTPFDSAIEEFWIWVRWDIDHFLSTYTPYIYSNAVNE